MLSNKNYAGGVPLVVRLSERDILRTSDRPAPVVFMLPRTTILIVVLQDVLEFFSPYTAALNKFRTQVWFSYGGTPISWLLPVGAVKDYVAELERCRRGVDAETSPLARAGEPRVESEPPPAALLSQPLELDFRIHQPSTHNLTERTVPFLVSFDGLGDFIRNEIRQLHKASYTVMYGTYKFYWNAPEAVLRSAVAMALYNPFSPPRTRSSRLSHDSGGSAATSASASASAAAAAAAVSSGLGVGGVESAEAAETAAAGSAETLAGRRDSATLESYHHPLADRYEEGIRYDAGEWASSATHAPHHNSSAVYAVAPAMSGSSRHESAVDSSHPSPYVLTEYQHLLKTVLHRRPVAYLIHFAFPHAHTSAASNEPHLMRYTPHRVSAAALAAPDVSAPLLSGTTDSASLHDTAARSAFSSSSSLTGNAAVAAAGKEASRMATSHERATSDGSSPTSTRASVPEGGEESGVTLGVALWRLFRVPCVLWLAQQQQQQQKQKQQTGVTTGYARVSVRAEEEEEPTRSPASRTATDTGVSTAAAAASTMAASPSSSLPSATDTSTTAAAAAATPAWEESTRVCSGHALSGVSHTSAAPSAYDALLRSLAPFYQPEEGMSLSALSQPEELRTRVSAPPRWAAWESERVKAFVSAYETMEGGQRSSGVQLHRRGIRFRDGGVAKESEHGPMGDGGLDDARTAAAVTDGAMTGRRIYFVVQGVRPSLHTPMTFLERHMTSSDRALYVVAQVA